MKYLIILFLLLTSGVREGIDLPRFVIYEDVFVYRNHPRGEVIYIEIDN